jgi:hypothetical protein
VIPAARSTDQDLADALTQIITGTPQYRGWRIDLHSYRVLRGLAFGSRRAKSVVECVPTEAKADVHALHLTGTYVAATPRCDWTVAVVTSTRSR